jgi:hypothetical protein
MAWCALIRVWDSAEQTYRQLILRIEDTTGPGCLVRLYDGEAAVCDAPGATPAEAMAKAVELARRYLHDESISLAGLSWMEI